METFNELIEEDLKSMWKSLNQRNQREKAIKKEKFFATLGSLSAAGKLDFQVMLREVEDAWRYYSAQQKLPGTPAGIVDFLETMFGMKMDPDAVARAVFGNAPPKKPTINSPNSRTINTAFGAILAGKVDENKTSIMANKIAEFAKANEEDARLTVQWMKLVGAQKPDLVRGSSALIALYPYAHGGILTDAQLEAVLSQVSRSLLKQKVMLARLGQQAQGAGATTGAAMTPTATAPVANTFKGLERPDKRTSLPEERNILISILQLGIRTPNNQPIIDNLLRAPAGAVHKGPNGDTDLFEWYEDNLSQRFRFSDLNAATPLVMQILARQQRPTTHIVSVMRSIGALQYWPQRNVGMAYEYIMWGGDPAQVTAELNNYAKTPDQAAHILMGMTKLEALERQGSAPKAAPTKSTP